MTGGFKIQGFRFRALVGLGDFKHSRLSAEPHLPQSRNIPQNDRGIPHVTLEFRAYAYQQC